MLRSLGLLDGNMYWLGRDNLAMASVVAVHTWRIVPLAAVIMLAGIISIPKDINDAAAIDGAGFWRRLWESRCRSRCRSWRSRRCSARS